MSKILSTAIIAGLLFAVTAPAFRRRRAEDQSRLRKDEGHEVG